MRLTFYLRFLPVSVTCLKPAFISMALVVLRGLWIGGISSLGSSIRIPIG